STRLLSVSDPHNTTGYLRPGSSASERARFTAGSGGSLRPLARGSRSLLLSCPSGGTCSSKSYLSKSRLNISRLSGMSSTFDHENFHPVVFLAAQYSLLADTPSVPLPFTGPDSSKPAFSQT